MIKGFLRVFGYNANPQAQPAPCSRSEHEISMFLQTEGAAKKTVGGSNKSADRKHAEDYSFKFTKTQSSRFSKSTIMPNKIVTQAKLMQQYDIVKFIGESKTATISLAVDTYSKKMVAIKRHTKRGRDTHVYKEATIQGLLRSEYIATLHAFCESDEYMYLVQEYMAGGELFDAVTPDIGCNPKLLRSYVLQLCNALKYLHQQNLCHRDIKPENIMLTSDKTALKLIDFGLSENWVQGAKYKQHIGTIPYMAPELLTKVETGYAVLNLPATDVWAAGIVFFALACGRFPWAEASLRSPEYRRYCRGELLNLPPWTDMLAKIPQTRHLLIHMLAIDVNQRWTIEQCVQFIETSWPQDPPSPKTRNVHNLCISMTRRQPLQQQEDPMGRSPLALSPHTRLQSSNDSGIFIDWPTVS